MNFIKEFELFMNVKFGGWSIIRRRDYYVLVLHGHGYKTFERKSLADVIMVAMDWIERKRNASP